MTKELVWLITGTSTGLGRLLTLAALKRGDKVIATGRARSLSKLDDLKAAGAATIELDVTFPRERLDEIAKEAISIYGRVDVVVNNAGYILVGAIEENTAEETYDQFNTNVFGALNVTRAFLPYMRAQKSGTILWFGSVGGWRGVANCGLYCTTKWALRGLSASLDIEISPLGLRSICIDFGYFRTEFLSGDHRAPQISRIPDYKPMMDEVNALFESVNGKQPGDPQKGVNTIIDLLHGESSSGLIPAGPLPGSIQLGSDCYNTVKSELESNLERLTEWEKLTKSTDF